MQLYNNTIHNIGMADDLTWKHSDITLSTLVKKFRMGVIDILGEAEIYTRYYCWLIDY